jgi:Ca2+-binding EF-hand superfamily protein
MKRVLTALLGAAGLFMAANRAEAVSYGPELNAPWGGGFNRWDANDDGVIDKAEFQKMRKALNNQQPKKKAEKKRNRRDDGRNARRGPGPAEAPLSGPKADRNDRRPPPPRGPAMQEREPDEGPPNAVRKDRRSRRHPGRERMRQREGNRRGPDALRGGPCCPHCPCKMRPERDAMRPESGHRRPRGEGPMFDRGPGQHRFGFESDRMPPPFDGPPMMRRHRDRHDQGFGMMGPGRRDRRREFSQRHPRMARRGREMARRWFDRFDGNDDQFITPDEFPGRPERFDRWDADDDGRIEREELKRDARRHRGGGAKHRGRGERGNRGPRDMDNDRPRGPRGMEDDGPHTKQTRAI